MYFLKKHWKKISNVLVVIAVLLAIYVKWTESGESSFIRENDIYIFAGIALGFVMLNFINKHRKK